MEMKSDEKQLLSAQIIIADMWSMKEATEPNINTSIIRL